MAAHESLDGLLAEALQCLDNAAGDIRSIPELDTNASLNKIGAAIIEIWELRSNLHQLRPDLKPLFVTEYELDSVRYEELSELSKVAYQYEVAGDIENARLKYKELCSLSGSGYFCTLGEAGLYRLIQKGSNA